MTGQLPGGGSRKVLVADDDVSSRRILSLLVQRAGHVSVEAGDGQEALLLARREQPDLILLDVAMPHLDGYQVCAELKADVLLRDVPIMLVSGRGAATDKIRGLDLGATDYITKPFDFDEVLARIRTQLRLRQLGQSLVQLNQELLQQQARLEEDLRAAAGIQRSLLPRGRLELAGVEAAWRFVPCGAVGGDIVSFQAIGGGWVAAYALDVSGHGLPSAMVSVWVAQTLAAALGRRGRVFTPGERSVPSPRERLEALDREYPFERFERFFTLCYAVLDGRTGELRYSAAGHPPPLLVRAGGAVERLDGGGPPIGLGLARPPYEEGCARLARGDRLLLYTDGLLERTSPHGEMFGLERLQAQLGGAVSRPLEEVCDVLLGALEAHGSAAPQEHDVSFLALGQQAAAPAGEG